MMTTGKAGSLVSDDVKARKSRLPMVVIAMAQMLLGGKLDQRFGATLFFRMASLVALIASHYLGRQQEKAVGRFGRPRQTNPAPRGADASHRCA